MIAGRLLVHARRQAGLSQRDLARRACVPHSTVARIELGRLAPRTDTLERLLRVAGQTLGTEAALGAGVDRSQIRELLALTPGERARLAVADAAALAAIDRTGREPTRAVRSSQDPARVERCWRSLCRDRRL